MPTSAIHQRTCPSAPTSIPYTTEPRQRRRLPNLHRRPCLKFSTRVQRLSTLALRRSRRRRRQPSTPTVWCSCPLQSSDAQGYGGGGEHAILYGHGIGGARPRMHQQAPPVSDALQREIRGHQRPARNPVGTGAGVEIHPWISRGWVFSCLAGLSAGGFLLHPHPNPRVSSLGTTTCLANTERTSRTTTLGNKGCITSITNNLCTLDDETPRRGRKPPEAAGNEDQPDFSS